MPSFNDDDGTVDDRWAVIRSGTDGDHARKTYQFYDAFYGDDDPRNVLSDLSGSTWASSVAQNRGGPVITAADVVVDLVEAMVTPTLTDDQVRLLTNSTYVWDFVEDPGLDTELTLIDGRMTVSGRATGGSVLPDTGNGGDVVLDGGGP